MTVPASPRRRSLAARVALSVAAAGAACGLAIETGLRMAGVEAMTGAARQGLVASLVAVGAAAAYAVARSPFSRSEPDEGQRLAGQRELEAELRRAREAVASTEAALNRFAHSASHDLRAPIRALDGFTTILLEDYAERLDADVRDYVRRMRAAASRLDRLVTDLHAYARVSSMPAEIVRVDLNGLVADVRGEFDQETVGPASTIETAEPLAAVMGDEFLLRTAVAQLLANAVKFTEPGGAARVRVSSETTGSRTRLYVDDEGIGVPEEHRARIFDVFERLHPESEYPGTGMGLALVARVAERLGGAAGVEPRVPKGSRFWIELGTA